MDRLWLRMERTTEARGEITSQASHNFLSFFSYFTNDYHSTITFTRTEGFETCPTRLDAFESGRGKVAAAE